MRLAQHAQAARRRYPARRVAVHGRAPPGRQLGARPGGSRAARRRSAARRARRRRSLAARSARGLAGRSSRSSARSRRCRRPIARSRCWSASRASRRPRSPRSSACAPTPCASGSRARAPSSPPRSASTHPPRGGPHERRRRNDDDARLAELSQQLPALDVDATSRRADRARARSDLGAPPRRAGSVEPIARRGVRRELPGVGADEACIAVVPLIDPSRAMRALVVLVAALARAAHARVPTQPARRCRSRAARSSVDGVLDDPTWQNACFADDFEQQQPKFGATPTHPVKVAIAIDGDDAVRRRAHVVGRAATTSTTRSPSATTPRQAERFIVSIDPSHTQAARVQLRGHRARRARRLDPHRRQRGPARPVVEPGVDRARRRSSPTAGRPRWRSRSSQLRLPREPAASWGIDFDWYIPHRRRTCSGARCRRIAPRGRATSASSTELPPIAPGLAARAVAVRRDRGSRRRGRAGRRLAHRWLAGPRGRPRREVAPAARAHRHRDDQPRLRSGRRRPRVRQPDRVRGRSCPRSGRSSSRTTRCSRTPAQLLLQPADRRAAARAARRPMRSICRRRCAILGAAAAGGYVAPHTQIAALARGHRRDLGRRDRRRQRTRAIVVSPLTAWGAGRIEHQVGASVLGATATVVAARARRHRARPRCLPRDRVRDRRVDAQLRTARRHVRARSPTPGSPAIARQRRRDHDGRGELGALLPAPGSAARPPRHRRASPARLARRRDRRPSAPGMWPATAIATLESPGFELNDLGALAVRRRPSTRCVDVKRSRHDPDRAAVLVGRRRRRGHDVELRRPAQAGRPARGRRPDDRRASTRRR